MRQTDFVRSSTARRGVALVVVLVMLAVLSVVMGGVTWHTLAGRRQLERRHNRLQSEWLARSGIELAAARLLRDPNGYKGESVEVIPHSQLRIEVKTDAEGVFEVSSEASFPKEGPTTTVRSVTRRLRRAVEGERVHIQIIGAQLAR
jgi:hypothetical protein